MFPFPIVAPARVMPDAFSFTNVVGASRNVAVDSAAITLTGFDVAVEVSATNGAQISVNGGTFSSLVQLLLPGQTLKVRLTSANAWATAVSTTITAGGRSATFSVTTATVAGGAWDTGWTAGSWTFTTPAVFNWVRVQMWAPGGGGGGGGGSLPISGSGSAGNPGGDGGYVQFAGGPYATGGSGGGGGQPDYWSNGSPAGGGGYAGVHGTGYGGDTNGYAWGAGGGAGGGGAPRSPYGAVDPGPGGAGGTGGYFLKTYSWGQIAPSQGHSVYIQYPGGGGGGGSGHYGGGNGAGGGYGRCYIDWG